MSHALPKGSATRWAYLGLFGLFLLVLLVWSKTGAQVSSSTSSSLVALYPMISNSYNVLSDVSGNNLNGTLSNFTYSAFGVGPTQTRALTFAGNSTVTVDLTPVSNSFAAFTFATVFQSSTALTSPLPIASGTDASGNNWALSIGTNGQPSLTLRDSKGNQQIVSGSNVNTTQDGNYHSLVITLNSTTARLYTDNIATESAVTWAGGSAKQLTLGSSLNQPFKLGQTALLGVALEPSQVSEYGLESPTTAATLTAASLSGLPVSKASSSKSGTSFGGSSSAAVQSAGVHPLVSGNLFTIVAGNNQIVPVSTFATNSLQVKLTNSSGTAIPNYPIAFALQTGSDGGFSTTNGGSTTTTLTVNTNSSGIATVYYKSGTDLLQNNIITATDTTDSLVVTFTEHCGTQTGLMTWYAADQVNGTGVSVPTNGSSVGTWTDLAQTNNVTQGTQASQPTFVSTDTDAKPAVHFNGSQSLYSSNTLNVNADMTMITVGFTSSPSSQQYSAWLGGTSTNGASRGMGYYNTQELAITNGYDLMGGAAPSANNPVVEAWTLDSTRQNISMYQNGSLTTTGTISGSQNVTAGISIGFINGYTTVDWQGNIQEVLVYNHQLSSAEMAVPGR